MRMANEQNLRRRSPEEARELGRMGGLASGAARANKAKLRADLEDLLKSPNPEGQGETIQTAVCVALIERAIRGDTKAFEIIRDTIGEKPADNIMCDFSVLDAASIEHRKDSEISEA